MIIGCQIRAARALLNMSQDELAKAAGLTPQAIRKIENGDVTPREGTINDIVKTFYEHRVEFYGNQGVQFIPEDVEVLNGEVGFSQFSDLIFEHMKEHGGVIRQIGIDESYFESCSPTVAKNHRKRMAPLVKSRKDIFVRAILKNGDTNFISTDYAEYRWHPKGTPSPVPYYLFGDTVCIFTLHTAPDNKIILIKSATIAASFIAQFKETWAMAERP